MSDVEHPLEPAPRGEIQRSISRRLTMIVALVLVAMIGAVVWVAETSPSLNGNTSTTIARTPLYPAGEADATEPSGLAPINPIAVKGYAETYVNDFAGDSLPAGWSTFNGIPGGDPTGRFSPAHVTVGTGLLSINAWKDPAFKDQWVTGGLCLCGKPQTYGAFFVRSRQTGSGPNEVELLWPLDNSWPPEIDFNETGGQTRFTSATVHWTVADHTIQDHLAINLSQWHTWGVIWTSRSIEYTVDGRLWAVDNVTDSIPQLPMTLDIEQRTVCDPLSQCPSRPTSLLVDWVQDFSPLSDAG